MSAGDALTVKLVLLGDSRVGKSSVVVRFVRNEFDPYKFPTIGATFLTQSVAVGDTLVKFEIWDTAGQEKYRSLAPLYYRGASAALVVYDLTHKVLKMSRRVHWQCVRVRVCVCVYVCRNHLRMQRRGLRRCSSGKGRT